jgi:hypothetical protein
VGAGETTMKITEDMVKTFTYSGNDNMVNLDSKRVPGVNPKFKVQLKLTNGKTITAPEEWRVKIWKWWYKERQYELIRNSNNAIIGVANSLLNQKHKIKYQE